MEFPVRKVGDSGEAQVPAAG
jgi:hypothetical protein